jgi:hypothetical protein
MKSDSRLNITTAAKKPFPKTILFIINLGTAGCKHQHLVLILYQHAFSGTCHRKSLVRAATATAYLKEMNTSK